MKKLTKLSTVLALSLMCCGTAQAQTPRLEIIPFEVEQGTTSKTITLDMINPGEEFMGFQCDLYFPNGMDIQKNRRGKYDVTFNAEADRTSSDYHTLSCALQSDGAFRLLCYSGELEVIWGEEGALVNIPLSIDGEIASGITEIEIKNVVITRANSSKVNPIDSKCSVFIKPAGSSIKADHAVLYGNYTSSAIACLKDLDATSVDLCNAISVANATLATANENTLYYLNESTSVLNSKNVVVNTTCDNLVVTDGYSFAAPSAFTATAASYSRPMTNSWGTICLPFALQSDANVQYYELSSVDANTMSFSPVANVAANTPTVFKKQDVNAASISIAESGVSVTPAVELVNAGMEAGRDWSLKATYATKDVDPAAVDADIYYIAQNKFWYANTTFTSAPFRAWFETPKSAGASVSRFEIVEQEHVSGVEYLEQEDGSVKIVFDLNGRRQNNVENNSVNIVNGKTVFVK